MTRQTVGIGTTANDGTGDPLRLAFDKINDNFTEIFGLQSATLNAAAFPGATDEEKIQSAINQGVADGAERVRVPTSMLPYNASLVTFVDGIRMVREGGDESVYDVRAYGAAGDNIQDDTVSWRATADAAALNPATNAGELVATPGIYKLTGNPFKNRIGQGNAPILLTMNGARINTTKQVKLPSSTIIRGTSRLRTGIEADLSFVASVAVSAISRTSNVVTVTTTAAHGLEVGASAVLQGVADTTFNGGWTVASTPTTTSYTFAQTAANTSSSGGTVYVPLVVLGDTDSGSSGVRLENLQVNAEDIADSIGIYSNNLSELSGAADVLVFGAYKYGIWLERHGSTAATGGPNNYRFENIEVYVTPNVAATGVYLRGLFGLHRGFDNVTTNTDTNTGTSAAGFDVSGCPGLYSRIHCEHATDGFLIGNRGLSSSAATGRDSAGIVIAGITGEASITNLVHLKNFGEVNNIVVTGIGRMVATNSLVDDVAGLTLTDDYIGLYAIGGIPTSTRFSTSPNVPWKVAAAPTFAVDVNQGSNALAALIQHNINAAAGQSRQVSFSSAGNLRWIIRCDSSSESGSDAGSAFQLLARTDGGAAIDVPITITRAAGGRIDLVRKLKQGSTAGIVCANAALSTSATAGFLYIPSCAGVPSGTPSTETGTIPLVYDSTNNNLYAYNSGWKKTTTFA